MAVINTVTKTTTVITDIQVGDVFEFVRSVGCRRAGELLVVRSVDPTGRLSYFGGKAGNYGNVTWMQDKIDSGELIYRPHTPV